MDRMDGWVRAPEGERTGADGLGDDGAAGETPPDGAGDDGLRPCGGADLADAATPDGVDVRPGPRCRRADASRRDPDEARRLAVHGRIAAGYERMSRGLRIIAFEILGDEHEAEDAAQDAFAKVLEHAESVRDPQATEAWLRRTVRNLAVNRFRRRRRCRPDARATDESLDADPAQGPRVVLRSGSSEVDPRAVVAVDAAFSALRGELREAASLYYLSGLSCAEVGRAQGVAEGCARTRVHRARRKILRGLFGAGDEA